MQVEQRERLIEIIQKSVGGCARNWAEIIADGLLANGVVVPPCNVGDVVYTIINGTSLFNSFRVESVDLLGFSNGIYSWTWHQLGKSVFLTLEEAERELERRWK